MRQCPRSALFCLLLIGCAPLAAGCANETGGEPGSATRPGPAAHIVQGEQPQTDRDDPVTIELVRNKAAGTADRFEVRGLKADLLRNLSGQKRDAAGWKRLLTVSIVDDSGTDYPPMLGEYKTEDGRLIFTPRFPLAAGARYRAVFSPSGLTDADRPAGTPISRQFALPAAATEPTAVIEQVFPTSDVLPENQLKFYIRFSEPMSRGEAYDSVHLLNAAGREVDAPFLELAEELWDRAGLRFTLLIDPGRIKRGLKPREEVGPALERGKSYTLIIDAGWLDATGLPLKRSFEKSFRVAAPDAIQPDHAAWKLAAPPAGTTHPLGVTFNEPLDRGMLERVLVVRDERDEPVAGQIAVDREETRWRFTPRSVWEPGEYQLVIGTALEDRAGNSIARPFETIIGDEGKPREPAPPTVSRAFTVE